MGRLGSVASSVVLALVLVSCAATPPAPPAPSAPISKSEEFGRHLEAAIVDNAPGLELIRAVLVDVGTEPRVAYYRKDFTADDHAHVWSVTKSVLSLLIGIAVADRLIPGVDAPLGELLPERRRSMSTSTAQVTLRQLMTMSAGFDNDIPGGSVLGVDVADPGRDHVNLLLQNRKPVTPGETFAYADNASSQVVMAVLVAALARRGDDEPHAVLRYARTKLFDPLGITTEPSFSDPLPDPFDPDFGRAGFGWGTNANGMELGGFGLRLTAPDLLKIGHLVRAGGRWSGRQLVPAAWLAESIKPSAANRDYGLGWWLDSEVPGDFAAVGFGGQRILVLTKQDAVAVVVVATTGGEPDGKEFGTLTDLIFASIGR